MITLHSSLLSKFSRVILCLGAMLALSSCGACKEGFDKGFKTSFVKSFVESCSKSAARNGGEQADIRSKCECTAKFLTDHYDSLALTKMSTNPKSEESRQMIKAALDACQLTPNQ